MSLNTESRTAKSLSKAALLMLVILQALMLAALYTKTAPHPPLAVPLFAIGPFISASIALAAAAFWLDQGVQMKIFAVLACLTALVSFGPQKYFDPAFSQIWPAVLLAQFAIVTVLIEQFFLNKKGVR